MSAKPRTHITIYDLVGACELQCELFLKVWPRGRAKITVWNMRKAIKAGLTVWWLESLIPACAKAKYDADNAAIRAKYYAGRPSILVNLAKYEADRAAILVAALTVQP